MIARHSFLNPSVSRLRSFTPGIIPRTSSDTSLVSLQTTPGVTSVSSHFSSRSRASSLLVHSDATSKPKEREVFKWTDLGSITQHFSSRPSQKAISVLGVRPASRPTVLAANGMICVGTEDGSVHVFDFTQTLKCVCGTDLNAKQKAVGRVTALALSHDHTYVASGHSTGHIFLYNLSEPNMPARSIPPATLSVVASGRKEGHLQGSRIVNIGFIGGRHTAIVSADEHGLAFYHNLGKVLFVEAFDTLRILGRYPEVDKPANGRKRKPKFTVLASSPLPLGTSAHVTDNYQVIALLTPTKLVVVGLRPSPKTWFKCPRGIDEGVSSQTSSKWQGTLAWFPSMASSMPTSTQITDKSDDGPDPLLVYTWGNSVHLIRITEVKVKQEIRSSQSKKVKSVDVGMIVHEEVCKWSTREDVLSIQWLNSNQVIVFTTNTLQVFDARKGTVVENLRDRLQVGTLMTWADQILSSVDDGDFIGAIEIARSYYVEEAPGNRNGLPEDAEERRNVIGERMRGLMRASTQYAFSEERMTDNTHVTPDHRGVDRTSLFEDLVTVSCRACIALDDFQFLFEDLFQEYDDAGIARIYLLQLQSFVLDNSIRYVPPRITQRLVALHEGDGQPDQIERIIWHIDPCLCQKHRLYDALIYVYTCALRDYVAPIVESLGIIRQKLRADYDNEEPDPSDQELFENAYKIFPYLETILTGFIYPSNEPLEEDVSLVAKEEVYKFLLSGRSRPWPDTNDGQVVLTSIKEGGEEPPYPYIRQLLSFDAEWFLHSLDRAFEKAFLDEGLQKQCQSLIQVLMEIVSSKALSPDDATFIRIFIARNVPKYSPLLKVPTNTLQTILPGFYRILRQRYLRDHRWSALLATYLDDTSLQTTEAVLGITDTFTTAQKSSRGALPPELMVMMESKLSDILDIDIGSAALLIDKYQPKLHDSAVELLQDDAKRFRYFQQLLGPAMNEGESTSDSSSTSRSVPKHLCHMYLSLQCRYDPNDVIDVLRSMPSDVLDWGQVLRTCETAKVYEAVIWTLNWRSDPQGAISKADAYQKQLVAQALDLNARTDAHDLLKATEEVVRMGISVCLQHSSGDAATSSQADDLWFQLFKSQVYCIQLASGVLTDNTLDEQNQVDLLPWLRSLVQETFGSFVSVASTKTVSFPRLFKRLVESVSASSSAHYTEFRSILTGMVESYRSDGDMLIITKHLVHRDLFETMASHSRERAMGWAPVDDDASTDMTQYEIVVSRTGMLYHLNCSPPTQ
ncbi:Golgi CORVET complex core vacuolar protein 8-domain-containing protein [Amanita rubescens]|nr:Golgi CORVET complex core vacuolar protein 8-domain-containing protein [Amanita rubescens]